MIGFSLLFGFIMQGMVTESTWLSQSKGLGLVVGSAHRQPPKIFFYRPLGRESGCHHRKAHRLCEDRGREQQTSLTESRRMGYNCHPSLSDRLIGTVENPGGVSAVWCFNNYFRG
jgi:hypothetical protein